MAGEIRMSKPKDIPKDLYFEDFKFFGKHGFGIDPNLKAEDKKSKKEDPDDEDEDDDDIQYFEAVAQEADKKNLNNRIYPEKVLKAALEALQPKLKARQVFAMTDHPGMWDGPMLGKIAAVITEASLNDKKKVIIKGEFIENIAAQEVKALLKKGIKVGVSARGYGDYDIDEKQKAMIFKDGYEIEGWDFVVYPAAKGAKVTYFESENKGDLEMEEIRTVDGLRSAYPELVALVEKPLVDKVTDLTAKVADAETKLTEVTTKFDETTKTNADLTAKVTDAEAKLKIAVDAHAELQTKVADAELKIAIDGLMKDHKFAKFITIPADLKSLDAVKTFVDAEAAKLQAFEDALKAAKPEEKKIEDKVIAGEPKAKAEDKKPETKVSANDKVMDMYIRMASK